MIKWTRLPAPSIHHTLQSALPKSMILGFSVFFFQIPQEKRRKNENTRHCLYVTSTKICKLECDWIHEGIWVSKSDYLVVLQWPSSIYQTIIIREPLESSWINHFRGSKPTAMQMNVWSCTAMNTCVYYLNYVLRYPSWWSFALWNTQIPVCASP